MEEWVITLTQEGPTGFEWLRLVVIGCAATGALAALAIGVVPPMGRWVVPKPDRGRFREFVPLSKVRENGVVETRNGWLAAVWKLKGTDHHGMAEKRQEALFQARKHTLDQIGGNAKAELQLRIVSQRIRTEEMVAMPPREDEELPNALREISRRWAKSQEGRTYRNQHYIVAMTRQGADGEEMIETVDEVLNAGMSDYQPVRLDGDGADGPMALYGKILSPVSRPAPLCKGERRLVEMVCTDRMAIYPDGRIRATHGPHERWTAVLGVSQIDEKAKQNTMMQLHGLQCEHTIVQSVKPLSRLMAKGNLIREHRVSKGATMLGSGGGEQILEVYEIVDGTHEDGVRSELYEYQMAVLAHGENEEELENAVEEIRRVMILAGAGVTREGIMAESLFWGVLPSYDVLARPWRWMSFPIAASWVPQTGAEGVQAHDWAPHSITAFRAADGGCFHFTWHPTEELDSLGHVAVIAPSGAGKTTLLSHLAGQTLRIPSSKVWVFDRFNGTEIFTHAMRGAYVRFEKEGEDEPVRLNPLMLEDSGQSRAFLRRWLGGLIPGEKTPEDKEAIERAIRINFEHANISRRRLEVILPAAFHPKAKSTAALQSWYGEDENGRIFNAVRDDIGGIDDRWVAFDCTAAFRDGALAPALISYLMYRIEERSRRTGDPTLVIVDETEPMLKTREFREAFRVGLQEGRKLHQVFVCCFQRPSAIEQSEIGDLIRGMCPTIIFAPNEQGEEADYKSFNLTDADMDFILRRTHRDLRHAMLVKRYESPHSAIVDTSLLGLGRWMQCFKANAPLLYKTRRWVKDMGHDAAIEKLVGEGRAAERLKRIN